MSVPDKYGTIHDTIQDAKLVLIKQFRNDIYHTYGKRDNAVKFKILSMPGKTFRCYKLIYSKLISKTGPRFKWAVDNHQVFGFEDNREIHKLQEDIINSRQYHIIPIHGDILNPVYWKNINPNIIDIDFCQTMTQSTFAQIRKNIDSLILKDSKFCLFLNYSCRDGQLKKEEQIDESEIEKYFKQWSLKWGTMGNYRSLGPMRFYWAMKTWSREITDMDKKRQLAAKKAWATIRANKRKESSTASNAAKKAWVLRKKRYGRSGTPEK